MGQDGESVRTMELAILILHWLLATCDEDARQRFDRKEQDP